MMEAERNTAVSSLTMQTNTCLGGACAKNVDFHFVQNELDACVK